MDQEKENILRTALEELIISLDSDDEDSIDKKMELICNISPDPNISDYIFSSKDYTVDEIIELIKAYKPIVL